MEKRENMRRLLPPLRGRLKELEITRVIKQKALTSLMGHHVFRIAVTGCTNACFSPYFSDFGVLGKYRPGAEAEGCTRCGACVEYCSENSISLGEDGPVFDLKTCVMCGGCQEVCDQKTIRTAERGYKVVAGGTGSRHPHIADTVTEFTDMAGVLKVLENAVTLFKETPIENRVITFRDVLARHGVEKLQP